MTADQAVASIKRGLQFAYMAHEFIELLRVVAHTVRGVFALEAQGFMPVVRQRIVAARRRSVVVLAPWPSG